MIAVKLAVALLLIAPLAPGAPGPLGGGVAHANVFDDEVAARRAEALATAGRAQAVVPLLGLLELWNDAEDRPAIAATLDEIRDDPRQLPDVRARATFLRSLCAEHAGDEDLAARLRASTGLLADFQVLGPFDNDGRSGETRALPPERDLGAAVDPAQSYPGKEHPVSWRRFPRAKVRDGVVSLDVALSPEQNVLGYLTAFVRVERDVDAALRLGSTGGLVVWVGQAEAARGASSRPARLDQDVVAVALRAGWNRLTFKLASDEGGWALVARLTALDGSPLAFEVSPEGARPVAYRPPPAGRAARTAAPQPSDLRRLLRQAAEGGALPAQRAYGLYQHFVPAEDPKLGAAERLLAAVADSRADPATFIERHRLAASAATDDDKARKLLEEALAGGGGPRTERARALTELGRIYDRFHRERRAEELWRAALVEDADYFPAALRLAELASGRGLPSQAAAMLEEIAGRHRPLSVQKAQAAVAERRGRNAEAERIYARIEGATRDDLAVLRQLGSLARARGDVDGAVKYLERMAAVRPDSVELLAERAVLLDGAGRSAEAHAVLAAALADCPDQPQLLQLDGKVLHRLGRDAEALAAFRRALELHPQDPELRSYAAAVHAATQRGVAGASGPDSVDLAREWSVPVEDLIARAGRAAVPVKVPAWVLLDRQVTGVLGNGLSQTFSQRVVQILDERGAREQGQAQVRYTPDSQSVEIKAARVYKPSGEVIEAASQSDQDTSEPWYGLYYDTHAQVIELPHLEPGDVVDVEYLISDVGSRNLFGNYFGEMQMLQEDAPRMESDYILLAPVGRKLYFNQPSIPGARSFVADQSVKGEVRTYRFHAEGVPRIEVEPGMPGLTSVGAYVHVSTFESWEQVAEWYRGLVREQLEPDEAIRQAVRGALRDLEARARAAGGKRPVDERARIAAIYDLVVKSTRYVGLEFGIHGYKPYRVSQVFQRKFGDCKDKASLLVAMLRLAGVDASLVLVRTRRGGDIAPYPGSLAPFDHAIAWVPRYDLFLDGTAEFSGSAELPAQDQDVPVLIVADPRVGGRGHLVRTPVLPPGDNRVRRKSDVTLEASGAARVALTMEVEGQAAHEWRSHYQSLGERRERLEKAENGSHPGARVVKVDFPSLEELEHGVTMQAQLEVPAWARPLAAGEGEAGGLGMPALGHEGELLRTYARLSERQHDLVLGYPWQQDEMVTVALPPGFRPTRLPTDRALDTPFGSFTLTVQKLPGSVVVQSSLTVRRHHITAAEYPAFRRFCLDVDRAVAQELVVSHE